jgi:hypothetical protein
MLTLLYWRPSHVLIWTPEAGAVHRWLVRVIATATAEGESGVVAQTADEDQQGRQPDWSRLEDECDWRWQGMLGYRREVGSVRLESLED